MPLKSIFTDSCKSGWTTSQTREAHYTVSTSKQHVCPCDQFHLSGSELILPIANPLPLIQKIHDRKMKAGVAISPDTPSTAVTDEVGNASDMILVMTVYPGTLCLVPL